MTMAVQFEKHFVQDLNKDIQIRQCGTIVFNADDESNIITVDVYEGTEPATLAGTVVCAVVCADGSTVPVENGTISGNTVSVTLTADCFAIPGSIGIGIQIVNGSVKTTILKAIYNVEVFETDTVIDPGSRITLSVADLIDDINTAVASIPADYSDLLAAIAPAYSDLTFPVPCGKFCWYDGDLYRAKDVISTSESWTAAHWEAAVIGDALVPATVAETKSYIGFD